MMPSLRPFLFSAALLSAASAQSTIKVGEIASLTGKEAAFGQSSHKGTLLAIEELNRAGGVLGQSFELISEDNQSKQGESATIAKKLVSRDKVLALLGEVASSRSLEIAPIAQAAKIPMISTNSKATTTNYTDLQKRAAAFIAEQKSIAQFLDRDTDPAFATTVMTPALQQFIKEPDDVDGLVKSIEEQRKSIFAG